MMLGCLLVALAGAWLLNLAIEKPFLRLRDWVPTNANPAPTPVLKSGAANDR